MKLSWRWRSENGYVREIDRKDRVKRRYKNDRFWRLLNTHGTDENARTILCGNLKEKWRCGLDSADFWLRSSDGTSEHHSETTASVRGRKFLVLVSDCQLLKKYSYTHSEWFLIHIKLKVGQLLSWLGFE